MPTDRSARRVLSAAMGITAIFDLTGMTVYQGMRPVLPPSPPRGPEDDPFAAALSTIMAARPQAAAERVYDQTDTVRRYPDDHPQPARAAGLPR